MPTGSTSFEDVRRQLGALLILPEDAGVSMPPAAYALDEVCDAEVQSIFGQDWVCLGREEEIPEPGDYFTTRVVGEPLIVVRGDDREVNVLTNVCRHKWSEVAEGKGNAKVFTCPYHAWTYRRDGRLLGAPYMDKTEGFDTKSCALPQQKSALWHGFIFVTLNPEAAELADQLSNLEPLVAHYGMDKMQLFTGAEEVWATNWKLLVENFTEGYHTFQAHRETLHKAVPTELTYWGHADAHFSAFYSPFSPDEPSREPYCPDLTADERKHVLMISLYPSLVLALAPDRVFYMCITPDGPDHTRVRW
ncbi:MAG: aromatic ring-hydroxylating dioxygenase subunit alpha, partial [Alphaproteobacteria bacterium]|nr:aromatic ring-hydroxylating dioxygenase subunit alpha [Alphaproteobacteria bacterium]